MKTSQAQQDKTRRNILASAVEAMSAQGFEATTMKQIARDAGIGDATIYNYFPTKEKLIVGYFEQVMADAVSATLATPGLDSYTLQERLQRLTDAVLEQLLPNREFVQMTHQLVRRSALLLSAQWPAKSLLRQTVLDFLNAAEQSGDMPALAFKAGVASLYADYLFGVISYWLADVSEAFADTTRLVDLSLGLLTIILRSGLINQLQDMGSFVLRSQLARMMQSGGGGLNLMRVASDVMQTFGEARRPSPPPPKRAARAAPAAPAARKPRRKPEP